MFVIFECISHGDSKYYSQQFSIIFEKNCVKFCTRTRRYHGCCVVKTFVLNDYQVIIRGRQQ